MTEHEPLTPFVDGVWRAYQPAIEVATHPRDARRGPRSPGYFVIPALLCRTDPTPARERVAHPDEQGGAEIECSSLGRSGRPCTQSRRRTRSSKSPRTDRDRGLLSDAPAPCRFRRSFVLGAHLGEAPDFPGLARSEGFRDESVPFLESRALLRIASWATRPVGLSSVDTNPACGVRSSAASAAAESRRRRRPKESSGCHDWIS
jgi:hypothetical protein